MKNFLTLLIAMLLLLPTAMHGTGKKVVTSIDITIPLPQDGMDIEDGEQIQITAAKTAYGDCLRFSFGLNVWHCFRLNLLQ